MGVILLSTHYLVYGLNGLGMPDFKFIGRVLEASAEILFLLLLILLAKGYTVTRARLRNASSAKVSRVKLSKLICFL